MAETSGHFYQRNAIRAGSAINSAENNSPRGNFAGA
jgi:hypothetical protein